MMWTSLNSYSIRNFLKMESLLDILWDYSPYFTEGSVIPFPKPTVITDFNEHRKTSKPGHYKVKNPCFLI